jgi:Leucine-rich repeat (LRR) protein
MPLTTLRLHGCDELTDLAPIAEAKSLISITLPPKATEFEFLRAFPKLQRIGFAETSYGNPDKTAVDFWKDNDEAGWLQKLRAAGLAPTHAKRLSDGTWDVDLRKVVLSNLELIRGAAISKLNVGGTKVSDLSPLRGMPLKALWIFDTKVSDLSSLKGMQLTYFHASQAPISDISVLRGMPVNDVRLHLCRNLTDLSPLAEAGELTQLTLPPNAKNFEFLRNLPKLRRIGYATTHVGGDPKQAVEEFWKEYDAQGWRETLRASGFEPNNSVRLADETWEVSLENQKIADLNLLRGAPISKLHLGGTRVTDLTPLRGMRLTHIWLYNTKVSDLRPLEGMPLEWLHVSGTPVKDISIARELPLKALRLHGCKELHDLSPLKDVKGLTMLTLPRHATNIEFLRERPELQWLGFWSNFTKAPEQSAAAFWKEYDAKKAAGSVDLDRQGSR